MKKPMYPGWWQVLIALLVQAISAASVFTSYSIVAAPLKAEFQPSTMVLMFGITVVSLTSGFLSPLLGSAFDRFSVRTMMLLGSVWISIGFFLLSFVQSMTQVVIIYAMFMAVGVVLLGPIGCATLLSRWFNRRRGLAMGLASSGGAVGGFILPPLLQTLIEGFEWRMALQLFGTIIFCFSAPLIFLLVKSRPTTEQQAPEHPTEEHSDQDVAPHTNATSAKHALRQPTFWLISLMLGSIFAGPMAIISNMIQFVATKGISASQGALLLSVISGANFAGKILCATASDRVSLRLAWATMLTCLGGSVIGFLYAKDFSALLIFCVICGLSSGGATPLWSLMLSRVYGPQRIGQIMGIMTFVIMPFTLLSPPIFGWVFDQTNSYNNGLIGYLCLLGLALLGLSKLRIEQSTAGVQRS